MKTFNTYVLNVTVAILDFLYRGREMPRFWVLETIARAPYFAFLSVLHFKESLGLRTEAHFHLMKEHFAQTVNETEHLTEMELRGGADHWVDRFLAYHLVLIYYWTMVVYYFIDPVSAYHLNEEVEWHAMETYGKYLLDHPDDEVISQIMLDEINHALELHKAMEMI